MKHILATTVAASALLLLAGGQGRADEVVRMGLDARDIGSLDPPLAKTGADEQIIRQVFNSLVAPPRGTLDTDLAHLQGEIAQSWEISADKKTWTFKLRPGVKWQKGYGEVSAEDVKYTFDRQLDPKLGSVYSANFKSIASIDAVDPLTVRFNLKQSDAFFYVDALIPSFGRAIVPKKAVTELGETFGKNPVGSGPFEFVQYRLQEGVTLKAFDGHYDGRPALDRIEYRYIPDENARTIGFLGNELDIIGGSRDPKWVEQMKKVKPDAILDVLLPGSLQFIYFNMAVKPLDDLRVRQAIAYAIDRSAWPKMFGPLHGPMPTVVPTMFYGALQESEIPADLRYAYDPAKAKALLAEAGFPNGFKMQAIISERDDYKTNMLVVQDMLRRVGIDLDLKVMDHAGYHAAIRQDQGTIVELSTAIAPSAVAVMNEFLHSKAIVMKPTANRNFAHYGELGGSIDKFVDVAVTETDQAKQIAMLKEAQIQILRDLPVVPLQTAATIQARQGKLDLGYKPIAGYGYAEFAKAKWLK